MRRLRSRKRGATTVELAIILPLIFLFILFALQLTFYLVSANVVQYATYQAARSYMVFGEVSLDDIAYPYSASTLGAGSGGLYTPGSQTTAEAVAEKIIFESLPWEHERIRISDDSDWFMKRLYKDGADADNLSSQQGSVRVKFHRNSELFNLNGVTVTYCLPVLWGGLKPFFETFFSNNPCDNLRDDGLFKTDIAIPISYSYALGLEP